MYWWGPRQSLQIMSFLKSWQPEVLYSERADSLKCYTEKTMHSSDQLGNMIYWNRSLSRNHEGRKSVEKHKHGQSCVLQWETIFVQSRLVEKGKRERKWQMKHWVWHHFQSGFTNKHQSVRRQGWGNFSVSLKSKRRTLNNISDLIHMLRKNCFSRKLVAFTCWTWIKCSEGTEI